MHICKPLKNMNKTLSEIFLDKQDNAENTLDKIEYFVYNTVCTQYFSYRHPVTHVGPSGVCALPLAAGINVVAIVLGIIFLSLSLPSPLLFYQKGGR